MTVGTLAGPLTVGPATAGVAAAPAGTLFVAGRLVELLWVGAAMACAGAAAWLIFAGDGGARRLRSLFPTGGGPAVRRLSGLPGGLAPGRSRRKGSEGERSLGERDLGERSAAQGRAGQRPEGKRGAGGGRAGDRGHSVRRLAERGAGAGPGRHFGHGPGQGPGRWTAAAVRLVARPETVCLGAAAFVAVLGRSVLPLLLGLAALPMVRRASRARGAQRARERRTSEVIALCGALAGEVRAGRHPGEALLATAHASGGLAAHAALLAAARFGGDVPRALVVAAREPGAEGLLGLAACWQVAVDSGAGLAAGLDRLEAALRAEQSQREDLRAQLSGPRSTAALLAVLPVFGLLLGGALGAHPLHVLLHTGAGLGCLLVGGVLEGTGLWWALRIVRNGERG